LPRQPVLTVDEQKLNDVWNERLRAEFNAHSADETVATMVANPLINEVPVMIGGDGKEDVYRFYAKYFLPTIPQDFEIVPVSRTIGQGRLVDEVVIRFTHTISMDWMLPGIQPTGKTGRGRVRSSSLMETRWCTSTCFGIRRQCWCSLVSSSQEVCQS